MLFNSLEFILFLPPVFAIYWLLGGRLRLQNLFMIAASYLFYGFWDWRFMLLMAFVTLVGFCSGLAIERTRRRKLAAGIGITLCLSVLCAFKYFGFFAESLRSLLALFGIEAGFVTLHLVLPVGISFYSLQATAYIIDVYRRKTAATGDAVAFFAFISFFPQLVAGPIERSQNLLPQFTADRRFDPSLAADGLRQALWGFFKKMVVADRCAEAVNRAFSEAAALDSVSLIAGAVLFAVQIYCDFSGYSDIAVGVAKLFGIRLMRNFDSPYFSRDIAEFWRRWHISLTTWFRDYVYIPLGGSRCSKPKIIRNTLIIFLLSGLWHGANWTFLLWGLYHALLFIPLILTGRNRKYLGPVAQGRCLPSPGEACRILLTFGLVAFGLIIFRADSVGAAGAYIAGMFTRFEPCLPAYGKLAFAWVALLFAVEWVQRDKPHALALEGAVASRPLRYLIYYALVALILVFQANPAQFVYFQF